MRMLVAFVLLNLAAFSSAQVIGFGGCPDFRPAVEFDLNLYAGRWYEIALFYNAPQEGLRCQSSNYTVKDGYYFFTNESGIDPYGKAYSYQIPVYRSGADPNNVTILYYASETTPGEFKVVFVDYKSYAILHDCNEYLWGFINVQNNWIIARDRRMSEEDYDDALRYLASMGVNVRKFKKADQEDCPVYRDVPEQDEDPENEDEPRE